MTPVLYLAVSEDGDAVAPEEAVDQDVASLDPKGLPMWVSI